MTPRKTHHPLIAALLALLSVPHAGAATIVVTTHADANPSVTDGECSLREALANARADSAQFPDCAPGTGDDEITFDESLFRLGNLFTVTINLVGGLSAGSTSGPAHALAIRPPPPVGPYTPRVRLVASPESPHTVMSVRSTAAPFTLERINIEGGRGITGGGINLESQRATFDNVHFIGNRADGSGGGALMQRYGAGEVSFINCQFRDNIAAGTTGGALLFHYVQPANRVSIVDSLFVNNMSSRNGFAVHFYVAADLDVPEMPVLDIVRSRFIDNSGGGDGAVYVGGSPGAANRVRVQLIDSLFQGNVSDGAAAGLMVSADQGSHSSARVERSSFIGNTSTGRAGGIFAHNVDLHVENSLFSENLASAGAALYYAIDSSSQPRRLALIGNTFHRQMQVGTDSGRTLVMLMPANAGSMEWIVSGNLFDPDPGPPAQRECHLRGASTAPPVIRGGDNISPAMDCLFLDGSDIHAAPLTLASQTGDALKPLAVLPQAGSPAIDAWPADACTRPDGSPLDNDHRGQPRPRDGDGSGVAGCDIGAFELPDAVVEGIFQDGFEG